MPDRTGADLLHGYHQDVVRKVAPDHVWLDGGTINTDGSLTVDGVGTFFADGGKGTRPQYSILLPLGLPAGGVDTVTPLYSTQAQTAGTAHTHPFPLPHMFRPPAAGDRVLVAWVKGPEGKPTLPVVVGILVFAGSVVGP